MIDNLEKIVDHIPSPVVVTDLKGQIVYVNPNAEKLFNNDRDLLHQTQIVQYLDIVEQGEGLVNAIHKDLINNKKWQKIIDLKSAGTSTTSLLIKCVFLEDHCQKNIGLTFTFEPHGLNKNFFELLCEYKVLDNLKKLSTRFSHDLSNPLLGVRSLFKEMTTRESFSEEDKALFKIGLSECENMRRLLKDFQNYYINFCDQSKKMSLNDGLKEIVSHIENTKDMHDIFALDLDDNCEELIYPLKKTVLLFHTLIEARLASKTDINKEMTIKTEKRGSVVLIVLTDNECITDFLSRVNTFDAYLSTSDRQDNHRVLIDGVESIIAYLGGEIKVSNKPQIGVICTVSLPIDKLAS